MRDVMQAADDSRPELSQGRRQSVVTQPRFRPIGGAWRWQKVGQPWGRTAFKTPHERPK
jgi:hypothetical protein